MKRFLESSSSDEDENDQGMGGDEFDSSNIKDEVDRSQKEYKKVLLARLNNENQYFKSKYSTFTFFH